MDRNAVDAVAERRGLQHQVGGTWSDRLGTRWRIGQARPYILPGSRVLDIGCGDGELFRAAGDLISSGIGVDPGGPDGEQGPYHFVRGYYPIDVDSPRLSMPW